MTSSISLRIVLFATLAFASSYLFFGLRPDWVYGTTYQPPELNIFKGLLPAVGVFLLGLIFRFFVPKQQRLSWLGKAPNLSLQIILIPIICLTAIGLPNDLGYNKHYWGLILAIMVIIYTLFEEVGWRGYLQGEIQIQIDLIKYSSIGFIWWFWHWDFLDNPSIMGNLPMLAGLIFASMGIGQIAKLTNSIIVCAAFHSLGNIAFLYGLIAAALPLQTRLIIVAICVISWVLILRQWPEEN